MGINAARSYVNGVDIPNFISTSVYLLHCQFFKITCMLNKPYLIVFVRFLVYAFASEIYYDVIAPSYFRVFATVNVEPLNML